MRLSLFAVRRRRLSAQHWKRITLNVCGGGDGGSRRCRKDMKAYSDDGQTGGSVTSNMQPALLAFSRRRPADQRRHEQVATPPGCASVARPDIGQQYRRRRHLQADTFSGRILSTACGAVLRLLIGLGRNCAATRIKRCTPPRYLDKPNYRISSRNIV